MQLNELLEKHTIEEISQTTKISKENLAYLFDKAFEKINRIKATGFVSILEREYGLEPEALRHEIEAYYDANPENRGVVINTSVPELKKESGFPLKTVVFVAVALLVWYASQRLDQHSIRNFFHIGNSSMTDTLSEDTAALRIGNENSSNKENN